MYVCVVLLVTGTFSKKPFFTHYLYLLLSVFPIYGETGIYVCV